MCRRQGFTKVKAGHEDWQIDNFIIKILIICVVLSRSTSLYLRGDFYNMTLPLDKRKEKMCSKQQHLSI